MLGHLHGQLRKKNSKCNKYKQALLHAQHQSAQNRHLHKRALSQSSFTLRSRFRTPPPATHKQEAVLSPEESPIQPVSESVLTCRVERPSATPEKRAPG